MDEAKPVRVKYNDVERAEIAEAAKKRREDAIEELMNRVPPYSRCEAEEKNLPSHHVMGEITERSVSRWLNDEGIEHRRSVSVATEMREGIPDIVTTSHDINIAVKSSIRGGYCFFPRKHVGKLPDRIPDPKTAVVWCHVEGKSDLPYDVVIPNGALIRGWSTLEEMSRANPVVTEEGDDHRIHLAKLREIPTLLEWLRSGNLP